MLEAAHHLCDLILLGQCGARHFFLCCVLNERALLLAEALGHWIVAIRRDGKIFRLDGERALEALLAQHLERREKAREWDAREWKVREWKVREWEVRCGGGR